MAKSLTEMAAEIASAQASHVAMSADEMEEFLKRTFQTLRIVRAQEETPTSGPLAEVAAEVRPMDPKKSIQRNKIICLECGKEFKQLSQAHLGSHGLTTKEYRKKHNFSAKQALVSKSLSAKRRKRAKELGLAERLRKVRARKK